MNRNTDVHAVYIVKLTLVLEIKNKIIIELVNWLDQLTSAFFLKVCKI